MKPETELQDAAAAAKKSHMNECTGFVHDESRAYEMQGFIRAVEWVLGESELPHYARQQ